VRSERLDLRLMPLALLDALLSGDADQARDLGE
jgi:hypothetical protein